MRGRGTLAIGGSIGVNNPTSLTRERGEYVVHVCTGGQGEIAILAEAGEHATGDGPAVSLPELGSLLLLLSLLLSLGNGIGSDRRRRRETPGTARVRVRLGVRVWVS